MIASDVTDAIQISLERDVRAFELPFWEQLAASSDAPHIFATPQWHRAWWEEFGAGKELVVLVLERRGEPFGIAPFYVKVEDGRRVLRWVGGIDLTDYLGPICSPADRAAVAEAVVGWLRDGEVSWDVFDAHNMPVPHGFAEMLVDHADRAGFRFEIEQEETAAILRLPHDWDGYLASLKSKERHELKRKRRRIEREHPDAAVRGFTEASLTTDLETFFDLHKGSEGMKGHFMKPEIATFFRRVAETFAPLGWLRLDFLEIGGTALAATFGFEREGSVYLYNSAYETELRRLSPGLILVSELLRDSIARELEIFDFMRGPERYKYQLGAEAIPLNNVRIFNEASA